MTNEESELLCDRAAESLGEHYDAVLILASWTENGTTQRTRGETGSYFAKIGMAHQYLESASHEDLAEKLADAIIDKEGWEGDDD